MIDPFLVSLGVKMLISAAIVVVAAAAVARSGPFFGAMIVTLPIAAGPAYVFLAMEHPPDFLEKSADASLISNAATAVFMSVYAVLAQSRGLVLSLGSAAAAWIGVVLAGRLVSWTLPQVLLLNLVLYWLGYEILRRVPPPPTRTGGPGRWWEVPMRATLVMLVAGMVILTARWIGPETAGLMALAPIGFTSMAVVLHAGLGGRVAAAVFANALPGMIGFIFVLLTVRLAVVPLGAWSGLALALGVSLAWNASLIAWRYRSGLR